MPELPEVHTTMSCLKDRIVGLVIKDVWSIYNSDFYKGKKNIKDKSYFKKFKKEIKNKKIKDIQRKGKYLQIILSDNLTILIHMKMTGHLLFGKYRKTTSKEKKERSEEWIAEEKGPLRDDPFNRFIRLVFVLSDKNSLTLSDSRKFATVFAYPTKKPPKEIVALGPDPLDKGFTFKNFIDRLPHLSRRPIKQVLLDQQVVSGIGNIYSDEILWKSNIHPSSTVALIPRTVLYDLYRSMKLILRKGIYLKGDSFSDYRRPDGRKGSYHYHHKVYQEKGLVCPLRGCRGVIKRMKIGGRSAHFCSRHQILYSFKNQKHSQGVQNTKQNDSTSNRNI